MSNSASSIAPNPITIEHTSRIFSFTTISDTYTSNRWISNTIRRCEGKWCGIDRKDGGKRLYRGNSYRIYRKMQNKGRLMNSYNREELLAIAWEIDLCNPDNLSRKNTSYRNYVLSWHKTTKVALINAIWEYLCDSNNIMTTL